MNLEQVCHVGISVLNKMVDQLKDRRLPMNTGHDLEAQTTCWSVTTRNKGKVVLVARPTANALELWVSAPKGEGVDSIMVVEDKTTFAQQFPRYVAELPDDIDNKSICRIYCTDEQELRTAADFAAHQLEVNRPHSDDLIDAEKRTSIR